MFFFMMGTGAKTKEIGGIPNVVCPRCGSLTSLYVIRAWDYFHVFLIPLVKWNKKYFATARCCRRVFELDPQKGEALEREGSAGAVGADDLQECGGENAMPRRCPSCGKTASAAYAYCPHCGSPL